MRLFWSAIALLAILAVILVWTRREGRPLPVADVVEAPAPSMPTPTDPPVSVPNVEPVIEPAVEPGPGTNPVSEPAPTDDTATSAAPEDVDAEIGELLDRLLAVEPEPTPLVIAATPRPATPADDVDDPEEAAEDTPAGEAELANGDADGATKPTTDAPMPPGAGTADDPYLITWDLLLTASQTYRPKEDLTVIPPEVERLEGSYVRLNGFFLMPLGLAAASEMLLMRNMWDGCCIGMPPTAYDAVETKLIDALEARDIFGARTGTITGRLEIDPYVKRGWLLAFYIVEDATFEVDW